MAAGIQEKNGSLEIGNPWALFQANTEPRDVGMLYDLTPDGKKILMLTLAVQSSAEPITLVVNWPALLKKQ
jgi:hypothetical protein